MNNSLKDGLWAVVAIIAALGIIWWLWKSIRESKYRNSAKGQAEAEKAKRNDYFPVLGEKLGWEWLRENWNIMYRDNQSNYISWVNANGESRLPYDIRIQTKVGQDVWVDVKTTTNKKCFHWSQNEREQVKKHIQNWKNKYYILVVSNVFLDKNLELKSKAKFQLIKYSELLELKRDDEWVYY